MEGKKKCRDNVHVELHVDKVNAEMKNIREVFGKQKCVQWIKTPMIKGKWQNLEDERIEEKRHDSKK
jgi:hypothetical protein